MNKFLPTSKDEIKSRGWDSIDVLFIYADAYIDHPGFGVPILAHVLEQAGYKVAILSQPPFPTEAAHKRSFIQNTDTEKECLNKIRNFGPINLFIAVGSGSVDSILNNYTAQKKIRNDDQYSEGGKPGMRPDNAAVIYSKMARKAFPDLPIILGGIEASLRRIAYYDFLSNKLKAPLLFDAPADFLIYGMGEKTLLSIANSLKNYPKKTAFEQIKTFRNVCYITERDKSREINNYLLLPKFSEIKKNKNKFAVTAKLFYNELNPYNARTILQDYQDKTIIINPPEYPLTENQIDNIYSLPFTRLPHPVYKENIPAYEMIKNSVTSHRGCFGTCSFCALALHQGKFIQSRSQRSIISEIKKISAMSHFKGQISDIGGPTANMYRMTCMHKKYYQNCRKPSCIYPTICKNLNISHKPQLQLLQQVRKLDQIKKITISSGIRYDLALTDKKFIHDLAAYYTGGHLKIAPEHKSPHIVRLMHKPDFSLFEQFLQIFTDISRSVNKEQYIVPYFISNFPGCKNSDMKELQLYLKKMNWKVQQVQSFIPVPLTLATAYFFAEYNPYTKEKIFVAKSEKERNTQRKILQNLKNKKKYK